MRTLYKILLSTLCLAGLPAGLISAYQNPTANAGPDLYVTSGGFSSNPSAILQGSGYDPNGGNLNFYWACGGGTLSNYNVPQPLFTAPGNMGQSAIYTCTLTVTSSYGLSASDSAVVYVNYSNNSNYTYNLSIQTNPATNNNNGQAALNGNISGSGTYGTVYAWFQWGTTASYGYESAHRAIGTLGAFDQHIADLLPGTTYHFRIVAQQNNGNLIYGQDLTFVAQLVAPAIAYIPPIAGQVLGASYVPTGVTNDLIKDSFFLPLFLLVLMSWLYFSGKVYTFADWLKAKM